MTQDARFKEATWYPQFLRAKPLEIFVNLEESEAAFIEAHPEFENESLGHRSHRNGIGLKQKQPVTAAEFRKAYPDFAPEGWWSCRPDLPSLRDDRPQWRVSQAKLREAWDGGFPLEQYKLFSLLLTVIDPQEVEEGDKLVLSSMALMCDERNVNAYYESLIWLNSQPWRARTCKLCKRRFIASWPSTEHCSSHCAAVALRKFKQSYRAERAKEYNENRRKARVERKRS
jgi:hypothetical protein